MNNFSAHKCIKLSLLRCYLPTHKFDVICISETYHESDNDNVDTSKLPFNFLINFSVSKTVSILGEVIGSLPGIIHGLWDIYQV